MTPLRDKIVEWLAARHSHSIYDQDECAKSFKDATGEDPCWPTHTGEETRRRINAGFGGYVKPTKNKVCYGWEIAGGIAHKYVGFLSEKNGRGFIFHDCLGALMRKERV